MKTILLSSDLDRTLIPNGTDPESPNARIAFSSLAANPKLRLAYVSGRDKKLVEEAVREYDLPDPDFVIADVGTSIYRIIGSRWLAVTEWQQVIGEDWKLIDGDSVIDLLSHLEGEDLHLQPPIKQRRYKISYFTQHSNGGTKLEKKINDILKEHGIKANLIWSHDELHNKSLLDILPPKANKIEAIRYLMRLEKLDESSVVFAGDSGNDLDALTSGLQAILVKNATDEVRQASIKILSQIGKSDRLYQAAGGVAGMNGNYAAGVIEGLLHFFPEMAVWVSSTLHPSD